MFMGWVGRLQVWSRGTGRHSRGSLETVLMVVCPLVPTPFPKEREAGFPS